MRFTRLRIAAFSFLLLTAATLGGGLAYLESGAFGNLIKRILSERSPKKLGITGEFSHLKIYFFPPGVGIADPKIRVARENLANIPVDAEIEAKELRASFAPFQMFTGTLRVDEVVVTGGSVRGTVSSAVFTEKPKKKRVERFGWDDLFRLQINGVRLRDTFLDATFELPGAKKEIVRSELIVKELDLRKDSIEDREGLVSSAVVRAVRLEPPASWGPVPVREASELRWDLQFTDQGLRIEPLAVELPGLRLTARGRIDGNLLDEKEDPKAEASLEIASDLGILLNRGPVAQKWGGEVALKATAGARVRDIGNSLKARYDVDARNFFYGEAKAAIARSEGELDLAEKTIKLKSLEMRESSGAEGAGRVRVLPTVLPLDLDRAFTATLELEKADLHWLGGVVAPSLTPLEAKISGKVGLRFAPGEKNWKLQAEPDLEVSKFALTNQKWGVKRPMKFILRPDLPIRIRGGVDAGPAGLEFRNLGLGIRKTQFLVAGGIRKGKGFDFTAKGPADLSEIREIAEIPIRGEGTIEARIHGPADALLLDFDARLSGAEYIDLHLGNLEGRVTYDDGQSRLRLTDMTGRHGGTFYFLKDGFIDLAGSDDIRLPIEVRSGKIEELSEVLQSLVAKISWYPRSLKGEVHGSVLVAGKIDMPRLVIESRLEGTDWSWAGERARKVRMAVGYDRGLYYAREVSVVKSVGEFRGQVEFDAGTDALSWNLSTSSLSLNDFDFFSRLEIPARSKIEIRSTGSGTMERLESSTRIRGYGTEVKGEQYQDSELTLVSGGNRVEADANLFGRELTAQLRYSLIPKQPSSFRMDLRQFDFSPAILILNPKLVDDPALAARASGHIKLDFLSTQFELARGEFEIGEYLVSKTGFEARLEDPISVPIQLGFFRLEPVRFRLNDSALILTGEGRKGDVDLTLQGTIDLAMAELLTSSIRKAQGKAATRITLKGPMKDLSLDGQLEFAGAMVQPGWLQTPFEDVDGKIVINRGRFLVQSLDAFAGGESFNLSGKIDTFARKFPEIDLRAVFQNNSMKMEPFDLVQVRGTVSIKGNEPPYRIGGNLDLVQALYAKSFGKSGGAPAMRGERFLPKDQDTQLGSGIFEFDLGINSNQGFFVRNEVLDAEFKGKARLVGTPSAPGILGEGRLIQGKVLFKDRPFVFDNVKIDFDDPHRLDPKFSAGAICDVNQYKIRVLAYGRASKWKAEFSSTPYLKENDIFAVLSSGGVGTGTGSSEGSRFAVRDRSYVSQGEAASLILHSMDFGKDVQSKTGFRFDVEEAIDTQTAASVFRPQNLSENVASPKVVIKRSVGKNISLSFGSTVGVGSRNLREMNAEYKLVPGMSMLGVWNTIEAVNTRESRTSFGLDLKFNRRFK